MSAVVELGQARGRDVPALGWWVLLGAAIALHLTLPLGWIAGIGLLFFVLVQRARPLDFITSYLLVVAGASVIDYTRGYLTFQLSILTGLLLFMLFCYVLERRSRWFTIPHTPLTAPLLIYLGMSVVNYGRGILVGNSLRYAGLELLAVLGIGSAFLIGNRGFNRDNARVVLYWIYALCLAHTALGVYMYAVMHVRTGGIWFTPVPGVAFAVMLALVLRSRTTTRAVLGLLALSPLLFHQFLSFTRGYWFAIIGSTLFTVVVYTGRGPGVGARWKRTGIGLLFMILLAGTAAILFTATMGFGDLAQLAGSRFASSAGTEMSWETGSNVVRLVEYFHVLDYIVHAPLFGYGLGFWFVVREPITWHLIEQWFVHQNYLLVTLKQGLVGLFVFLWMLFAAFRTGMRGRNLPETWQSAWCVGTAAATLYLAIYCNVHFPLAEVNTIFITALVWGGAMSLVRTGETVVRWRKPHEEEGPGT